MNKKTVLSTMMFLCISAGFAADPPVQKEVQQEKKLPKDMVTERTEYDHKILDSFDGFIRAVTEPITTSDELIKLMREDRVAEVIYLDDKIISYRLITENYFGGAHENYKFLTGTIIRHPSSGKPREMKLTDIVTPEQLPEMQKLIMEAFKKEYALKNKCKNVEEEVQEHFKSWSKPMPTENFYYDAAGLHFVYEPYQIDCFASGDYDLCIQWPLPKCVTAPAAPQE